MMVLWPAVVFVVSGVSGSLDSVSNILIQRARVV